MPYKGIRFLAITQPYFTIRAEIFYENSRDYYLLINVKKFRFRALFVIFDFLGPKKGRPPQVPL